MELSQIEAAFRRQADDLVEPFLVSSEDVALYASEAEREACVRAKLLFDSTTTEVVEYPVSANQGVIDLHAAVDVITSARFLSGSGGRWRELELTGLDWVEEQCDWQGRRSSKPSHLVHLRKQVRIWPTPSMAGTLRLDVYRLPLLPMEDPDDEPEIDEEHHEGLVNWMLHKAFSRPDAELFDLQRAANSLGMFIEQFGERDTAEVRRRHRERRRITTRCGL